MDKDDIRDQLRRMRRQYGEVPIENSGARSENRDGENGKSLPANPFDLFRIWFEAARDNQFIVEPNAMVLSTVGESGPIARTVLMKDFTEQGFTFFTNYNSRKGKAIAKDHRVSLLFPWYQMERQIIIQGRAIQISARESDLYFDLRPYGSQISAWASNQSEVLNSREELMARYDHFAARFPEGKPVPRPEHWGGYLVIPQLIEFWQGRNSRLHDRIQYRIANGTQPGVQPGIQSSKETQYTQGGAQSGVKSSAVKDELPDYWERIRLNP